MRRIRLADRINQLPYETWLGVGESAQRIGVSAEEAATLLRAGRRSGMITVRRNGNNSAGVLYKRIRRQPAGSRTASA